MKAWLSEYGDYIVLALVALVLHVIWRNTDLPFFINFDDEFVGGEVVVLVSAIADTVLTMLVVAAIGFVKLDRAWLKTARLADMNALAVIGFSLALVIELKSVALHQWTYAEAMPTVIGTGLSPLLQFTLILPFAVYFTKRFMAWVRSWVGAGVPASRPTATA